MELRLSKIATLALKRGAVTSSLPALSLAALGVMFGASDLLNQVRSPRKSSAAVSYLADWQRGRAWRVGQIEHPGGDMLKIQSGLARTAQLAFFC